MTLIVASGGNEYYGKDNHLLPRVYLNDGKGNLKDYETLLIRFISNCILCCAI